MHGATQLTSGTELRPVHLDQSSLIVATRESSPVTPVLLQTASAEIELVGTASYASTETINACVSPSASFSPSQSLAGPHSSHLHAKRLFLCAADRASQTGPLLLLAFPSTVTMAPHTLNSLLDTCKGSAQV